MQVVTIGGAEISVCGKYDWPPAWQWLYAHDLMVFEDIRSLGNTLWGWDMPRKEGAMPTEVTEHTRREFVHTCEDGKHTLRWSDSGFENNTSFTLALSTVDDNRYGPYCHWCGEKLEE